MENLNVYNHPKVLKVVHGCPLAHSKIHACFVKSISAGGAEVSKESVWKTSSENIP